MSTGMNATKSRGGFGSFIELSESDLKPGVTVWIHGGSRYDIYSSDPGGATQINNGNWALEISTGGSGEANTASNLGSGSGLFAQKNGVDLEFKSISSTDFSLSSTATEVSVDLPAGQNLLSDTDKTKLDGIAENAQVNVQSDWDESNTGSDAYINNKPDFRSKQVISKITSGTLPNWASLIVDTSAPRTIAVPSNPEDKEVFTAYDSTGNAETNNVTFTTSGGTTIVDGVLDKNGQSSGWIYDQSGDVWERFFNQAPTSGGGGASGVTYRGKVSFSSHQDYISVTIPSVGDTSKVELRNLGNSGDWSGSCSIFLNSTTEIISRRRSGISLTSVVYYEYTVYPQESTKVVSRGVSSISGSPTSISIPNVGDMSKVEVRYLGTHNNYSRRSAIELFSQTSLFAHRKPGPEACDMSWEYTING